MTLAYNVRINIDFLGAQMLVSITEIETNKHIGTFPIVAAGANYEVSEQEICDLAWRAAVEDGLVSPDSRSSYCLERISES